MTTPQSQAEAMAVEVIKEWRLTGNALVSCISTALSKLIAENERLKGELKENDDCLDDYRKSMENAELLIEKQNIELAANRLQLTATEAKLSILTDEAEINWEKLKEAVRVIKSMSECERSNCGDCFMDSRAFLSTLTAEKKEQG